MKKILMLLLILPVLQGCFWNGGDAQVGLMTRETENFTILIPDSWGQVDQADIPTPKSGSVVLAHVSSSERQGYLNNIIILETQADKDQSSESLMKESTQSLKKTIENFKIIEEKQVIFTDDQTGDILIYSGKYNSATPEAVYIQTVRSCGENNYHITVSLTEKLESYSRYEYILQTFNCKS